MAKRKKQDKVDYADKSIDEVLVDIRKRFGSSSVRRMDDVSSKEKVEVISTGSLWVDEALGIGGLPRGRTVEVYGPESSGKTTVSLHCIAEAQRAGGNALFIDAENALDMPFATRIGVDPAKLVLSQPDSAEQALDVLQMGIESGKFAIAVVDSVSALVPQAELDGDMGASHMGLQARLMGQALRKINNIVSNTNTLVIFINQIRMKIGVTWGSPEVTSGGQALKFFASVRLEIRRIGSIKVGERIIGNKVKVKIVKNKLAAPFREIETDLIFGSGFSKESELLQMADEHEIIEIAGASYRYHKNKFAKSKILAIEALKTNRDLYDSILADLRMAQTDPNKDVEEKEEVTGNED